MGIVIPKPFDYLRRFALMILILGGLAACGKKMPPIPPDSLLPGPVRDFTVRQQGRSLVLQWLLPRENIEGQPLTEIQGFRLLRGREKRDRPPGGCPPELMRLADIDLAYPQIGEVRGEAVAYQDSDLIPGYRYYYQVIGYDRERHLGAPSPILTHAWGILPRPPEQLQTQAGDRLVNLDWNPVARLADGRPIPGPVSYLVYRQTPGEKFHRVTPTPLTETRFQDITVANDVEYRYVVRAVRQVGEDFLESLDSVAQSARPMDLTPPPPVLHLVAVPTRQGVELRWEPNPAKDLAGYRVYRATIAEPQFRCLHSGLWQKPYYVDAPVRKGELYYYHVTAVDNSPRANESLPSEQAAVRY